MKRKRVSASTLQLGMVYGGLIVAAVNPLAGVVTAGVLYKLYKARKAVEDEEREVRRETERAEFKAKFYRRQNFPSYEAYLASSQWALKRAQVAQRASGRCEAPGCTCALEEVHHKRYPRVWGNEPIDWLVGLCEKHHREEHGHQHSYVRR